MLSVLTHFGLEQAQSIYAFAPVYKAWSPALQHWVVLKQTRNTSAHAQGIQAWCTALNKHQTPCVQAIAELSPNPRYLAQHHWVVYPFLEGHPYQGSLAQIEAAGAYLGKMHQLNTSFDLPTYSWPAQEAASLEEDRQGLLDLQSRLRCKLSPVLFEWLQSHPQLREGLKQAELPHVTGSWDYKANNLIFQHDTPILIDPDAAGYLPRLLDLALAALLFHNELPSAPARMFNAEEWQAFLKGYTHHIALTPTEKSLWPQALQWMFLEEALWLLLAEGGDTTNRHQHHFLKDVLALAQKQYLFQLH